RLTFLTNSTLATPYNWSRTRLLGGTVRLDRPNGQSFVGGEFGTGTDLEFMSAAVRGGLVQLPFNRIRLDFFGGQTTSGVPEIPSPDSKPQPNPFASLAFNYDTTIFGAIATTATPDRRQTDFTFSGGAMHFDRSNRKGNTLTGGLRYMSGLNRLEADVAVGQFSGVNRTGTQTNGSDLALSVTGSYQLTEQLIMQGRYAYVGPNFLSPQSGLHQPTNLTAAGLSWQPRRWVTAAVNASN